MTLICAGALLAGFLSALVLPFLPFAVSLVAAIMVGTVVAIIQGRSAGDTATTALAILVACQVGYGLRLILAASLGNSAQSRRPRSRSDERALAKRLNSERD